MPTSVRFLIVATFALLQGCATPPPAKQPFDPLTMAVVSDTADRTGRGSGRFFVLAAVNGQAIEVNSLTLSHRASFNRGMNLSLIDVERPVPAGKVTLRLKGQLDQAAPIQTIFVAAFSGGNREVEGQLEVDLKPGVRYRVRGVIDELRSEVWLEELTSHQVVGQKFAAPPTEETRKAQAAELRYTCCNLHRDREGWISDANWINLPMIPAGSPIRVYDYGRNRAKVLLQEQPMWLGLDYGREQQTTAQLVARLTVKDDPAPRIAAYPAEVQAAIRAGKLVAGMRKEEAIVAIGYPRSDLTRSLDQSRWSYRTEDDVEFVLLWDGDDRLTAVNTTPEVRAAVWYTP